MFSHQLTNTAQLNELLQFLNCSVFPDMIELGNLYGEFPLGLVPGSSFLHEGDACSEDLTYANHGAWAVSYGEGHPSEAGYHLVTPNREVLRRIFEARLVFIKRGKI